MLSFISSCHTWLTYTLLHPSGLQLQVGNQSERFHRVKAVARLPGVLQPNQPPISRLSLNARHLSLRSFQRHLDWALFGGETWVKACVHFNSDTLSHPSIFTHHEPQGTWLDPAHLFPFCFDPVFNWFLVLRDNSYLSSHFYRQRFLHQSHKRKRLANIDKMDNIKIRYFCSSKDTIKRVKIKL